MSKTKRKDYCKDCNCQTIQTLVWHEVGLEELSIWNCDICKQPIQQDTWYDRMVVIAPKAKEV